MEIADLFISWKYPKKHKVRHPITSDALNVVKECTRNYVQNRSGDNPASWNILNKLSPDLTFSNKLLLNPVDRTEGRGRKEQLIGVDSP